MMVDIIFGSLALCFGIDRFMKGDIESSWVSLFFTGYVVNNIISKVRLKRGYKEYIKDLENKLKR